MATTKGYEVLVDELTVPQQVGELRDANGNLVGIQQGRGKTWFRGEVIPADSISPSLTDALEDKDHPKHESVSRKLKKAGSGLKENLAVRLGLPFAGYDDMSEAEIVSVMRNLPSPTIQAIKQYESNVGEGRTAIVDFNIGFGEAPDDRLNGNVGSQLDEDGSGDDSKVVAAMTSREVSDDGVQRGEGITGTGDPQKPIGEEKDETTANGPASPRRQRRKRNVAANSDSSTSAGAGAGAGTSESEQ